MLSLCDFWKYVFDRNKSNLEELGEVNWLTEIGYIISYLLYILFLN